MMILQQSNRRFNISELSSFPQISQTVLYNAVNESLQHHKMYTLLIHKMLTGVYNNHKSSAHPRIKQYHLSFYAPLMYDKLFSAAAFHSQ